MTPASSGDHSHDEATTVAAAVDSGIGVAAGAAAGAAAAPADSSQAHEREAAVSTTSPSTTVPAAAIASTTTTAAVDTTEAAAAAAASPNSSSVAVVAEPAQHPPLSSPDVPEGQQPSSSPRLNGASRSVDPTAGPPTDFSTEPPADTRPDPQTRPKADPLESEPDMSNHRPGPSAPAHHHNHSHNHHHHHHSHSLSANYSTTTSSGSSPVYPAPVTALSTTQYAASYPTVTSAATLSSDPFRVSPVASTQMPLPSMRTIDAISQGQSPAVSPLPHHTMSLGINMPLVAVSAAPPYYSGHSLSLPSNYALPQDLAQYPLPPHDPRLLNHRGPKKEIKRRTKTGCLTCRKRRIKLPHLRIATDLDEVTGREGAKKGEVLMSRFCSAVAGASKANANAKHALDAAKSLEQHAHACAQIDVRLCQFQLVHQFDLPLPHVHLDLAHHHLHQSSPPPPRRSRSPILSSSSAAEFPQLLCDETHPTCNNCRKSKRDCLGYDPIFRQPTASQSANTIQPAPGSLPPSPPTTVATSTYPNPSVAQVPASRVGNSYGTQQSMLPGVYSPTTTIPSPTSSTIPAIASAGYHPSLPSTAAPSPSTKSAEAACDYPTSSLEPTIRQFPPTPASVDVKHLDYRSGQFSETNYPRANKMKINEIIDLLGPPASPQQISHTEDTFHEITKVYHEMYAPGLSAFFETSWFYFTENGKMSFPKDANLIEHMATFLKILEGVKANDHSQIAVSGALETRIVWELACTAYQTTERANTNPMRISLPAENDGWEARNRLQVVEALLCGDYLAGNPLSPPVSDSDHHRIRQFDFWFSLGEFVKKQDNPNAPGSVKNREDALSRMRHLLDGRENRDVLYSIAVVRELAPGFEPGYGNTVPQHLDESDPKNRLAVASKFIMDESQVSGGTTNVVRRFSDIASRAFVNPGVNIARRV